MRVKISEDFKTAYKRLKKRHKSLQDDFERLLASLLVNPVQGVELVDGVRKIRLAITSKGLAKAEARVSSYGHASWTTSCNCSTSTTRATTRTSQKPSSATSSNGWTDRQPRSGGAGARRVVTPPCPPSQRGKRKAGRGSGQAGRTPAGFPL